MKNIRYISKKLGYKGMLFVQLLCCLGCMTTSLSDTEGVVILSPDNCRIKEELKSSECLENVKYVALETDTNCILGPIHEIKYCDSLLFLSDRQGIYTFDTEGRFLAQIGRQGRGPEEYTYLSAFYVREKQKTVVLLDGGANKSLEFTYSGVFIGSQPMDNVPLSRVYCAEDAGDRIALNYKLPYNDKEQGDVYAFYEADWKRKNNFSTYVSCLNGSNTGIAYSGRPTAKGCESTLLLLPFSGEIYEYAQDSVKLKYQIETLAPLPDRNKLYAFGKDYFEIKEKILKGGYSTGIELIFQSEKYLIACMGGEKRYSLLWNKEKEQGMYVMNYLDEHLGIYSNHILGLHTASVGYKNGFISVLPGFSEELKEKIIADGKVPELIEVLKQSKEEDNPIIAFYRFKEGKDN